MTLTPELKAEIDAKSVEEILRLVRFEPVGSPWFCGDCGPYVTKRLSELRSQDNDAYVAASKAIGWGR